MQSETGSHALNVDSDCTWLQQTYIQNLASILKGHKPKPPAIKTHKVTQSLTIYIGVYRLTCDHTGQLAKGYEVLKLMNVHNTRILVQ